jgi:potassium efflux system protein
VDGVVKVMPLTLSDLVVGIIFLSVTILAAKNIPGILEITLLQRLPLDAGSRYAITALSQYSIAGIGIMMAFSHIGLQWSNIQWLVAALSVGLGFGLQEIVANFISGIILLFERPIRVGDVVTVNNTTGVVSRIRIRATTITKYDKQELLIPNKQFITAEVTNWTLSNKMNRILITVGVGYEADVDRAMALMIEAAEEHPEILDDPIPVASFEAFGDNSLTLMLRSYLGSMDNRLAVITALHRAIKVKLDAAGISIAFPQRDLHLDSKSPLEVRITQDSMPMI